MRLSMPRSLVSLVLQISFEPTVNTSFALYNLITKALAAASGGNSCLTAIAYSTEEPGGTSF